MKSTVKQKYTNHPVNRKLKRPKKSGNNNIINRYDWRKEQYCFHCGCRVYLDGEQNPNSATIDHIFEKTDIRRYCVNGNKNVLSCYNCNFKRNEVAQTRLRNFAKDLDIWHHRSLVFSTILLLGHVE